jgi:hypothetical protein
MFWNCYVLKLLCLETITFSNATLSNINVVLCYVLSQYPLITVHELNLNAYFSVYYQEFQRLKCVHFCIQVINIHHEDSSEKNRLLLYKNILLIKQTA